MSKNGAEHANIVRLTTPLTAGVSSARIDGAGIGCAASVRVTFVSCRAGANLETLQSLDADEFSVSPLYCQLIYSQHWFHRERGNMGQTGRKEPLAPGAWDGLGVGLVFGGCLH